MYFVIAGINFFFLFWCSEIIFEFSRNRSKNRFFWCIVVSLLWLFTNGFESRLQEPHEWRACSTVWKKERKTKYIYVQSTKDQRKEMNMCSIPRQVKTLRECFQRTHTHRYNVLLHEVHFLSYRRSLISSIALSANVHVITSGCSNCELFN